MSLEEKLKKAILTWDEKGLKDLCNSIIKKKELSPEILIKIIGDVMKLVGDKFEKEEYMLPELLAASNVVKTTIDEIIDPAIKRLGNPERKTRGKIVLGTVEGDIHSIGKDLVASILFSNGFDVYNLGVDVPAEEFIRKAEEVGARVIGLSSLITLTMDSQREIIEELKKRNIRDKYIVIVGGAPTSEEWANKIGADAWADNAFEAVNILKKIVH